MYLIAKTTLLAFWIICKICVTFVAGPMDNNINRFPNNRLAGFYAFEHRPLYNPLPGFNGLNIVEPIFGRNQNERNNAAHVNAPENNSDEETESDSEEEAESNSENEGEILSEDVRKCKAAIKTYFRNSKPEDNLVYAFYKYSEKTFNEKNSNYQYNYGYYKDLVNKATDLESSNIWSVQQFCAQMYESNKEECVVNIEKTGIDGSISGHRAFEFMYLKFDYEMITLDLFPEWKYESMNYEKSLFDTKLQTIQQYFLYLFNHYDSLNINNLNTRHGFCQEVC